MRLPLKCTVDYIPDFLTPSEATDLYDLLIDEYQLDQAQMVTRAGGRLIKTDSFKILFVTDELLAQKSHPEEVHGKNYVFAGKMAALKRKVEQFVNHEFDLAMCLYYPNGNFGAPYHRDQQTSGKDTILPSLSLGAVREFSFKKGTNGAPYNLQLAHGSALIMGENCQSRYMHSLLEDPGCNQGRINITFRERNFQ